MAGFANRSRLNIKLGAMARTVRPVIARTLRRGGLKIENDAAEGIIDPPKTGRIYPSKHRKGAKHQASAPGEFPAADSGRLHQSITTVTAENSERAVVIETAANTPYAEALELGTSKMQPRPYMTPSFRRNAEAIKDEVTLAVAQEVRKQARRGK